MIKNENNAIFDELMETLEAFIRKVIADVEREKAEAVLTKVYENLRKNMQTKFV